MTLIALALAAALAGDPDTVKLTVEFENTSLADILEHLTLVSQIPIELDDTAKKKLGDPSKVLISIKMKETSVTALAKLMFGPYGLEVKVVDQKKLRITVSP